MIARDHAGAETWLLSLPPTRRQTRWVVTVAVCQIAAFALLAPFAGIQVGQINGFIPAVESVVFVTDLVTSVLLFSQFATHRLTALLVLACGYLLSALIIVPHALSFPGAFSPIGLPGAELQTTPWLYWFWHFPFAMALLGYGLMRNEKFERGPARGSSIAVIVRSVVLVLALACGLVLVATVGKDHLPALFADSVRGLPANEFATYSTTAITMLVCGCALAVLWLRRRSVLDEWLMIVALAVILEIGIVVLLSPKRFDVGFYAGRLSSLLTSTIVLVVLLVETMRLYANVARSNEAKIRRLVDANVLGIFFWNLEGAIVAANEEFLRMLEYDREDVVSGRMRWTDLTPTEWRERDERALAELLSSGTFQPFEKEYLRKDGSRMPVLIGGTLFEDGGREGVAFVLDLTERKRAEEARRELEADLAHMNRLSMFGELATSLAHEILHPVATARNNARAGMRFLEMSPPNLDEAKEALSCVVRDADRAKDIVGRMRDQIKKAPPRKERFDLNGTINEVIVLARSVIVRNGVSLQARLADGLFPVQGDRVQLQQVVLNLILNAVEAMDSFEAGARELSISSEQDRIGILVVVRDTGPGIDATHLERVFEAFFTTKSNGLGMGLAICRSIIDAHGGRLWAEANEPRGAVFQFTLPSAQEDS